MCPHLCPLLATFCINTPNSSYTYVFTVVFWPVLCDSVSFMFFLVQFPIKFLKSIYFFSFCCLSLPLSVSLLICSLWLIDLGISCHFIFFLRVVHLMPLQTHFIFGSAFALTGFKPSFLEDIYLWTQELISSVSESFCGMPWSLFWMGMMTYVAVINEKTNQ